MMEALGLSAPEFLEYYQERQFQSDIYKLKIGDSSENEQRSFFDILAFENFDVEALRLLEMLSVLDPDSIPEFLLITSKGDVQLPNRYPNTEESYKAARNYLERRSLISRDMDKQELTIHRVIQESVRARMSDEDFRETLQGAINLVTIAWAPTAGRWDYVMDRWSQCGLLFSHIETLRDEFLKCPDDYFSRDERLKAAKLLIEAGWYHFEKGNIEETIPFIDPTFNLIQNNNKESAQALSDAHFCLSSAYLWLRDTKKQQYHAQRC
ncbi:hypothetical protein GGS24DRAFT_308221 [Hypoxylon argillaceum]|nr:hypothetical protein GGS24DRAFT_308221 [Hypoxylon argillaceum]